MKLKIISMLVFISTFSFAQESKKYQIKSAVITFENTITIMGMAVSQKQILYFDDYGMKECKEFYEDTTLMESVFCDGKETYTVIFDEKVVYKTGKSSNGTEPVFAWSAVPEEDKKSGKAKKLDSMIVAGKACEAYEHTKDDAKTIIAGRNNIRLFTDLKSKDISSTSKAVSIKENVNVQASKFMIPKAFLIKNQ